MVVHRHITYTIHIYRYHIVVICHLHLSSQYIDMNNVALIWQGQWKNNDVSGWFCTYWCTFLLHKNSRSNGLQNYSATALHHHHVYVPVTRHVHMPVSTPDIFICINRPICLGQPRTYLSVSIGPYVSVSVTPPHESYLVMFRDIVFDNKQYCRQ